MSHNHITPTFPWYNPSRISTWNTSGEGEAIAKLLIKNRPLIVAKLHEIDVEAITRVTTLDVIEIFLKCDNLKIVAQEGEVSGEITIEVELEDIDDLVTEELAEIYHEQGLIVEAKAIYTKLSLLNSEKSVYFAELIEKMEQNN
ncbi:MAG: hypothetical protein SNG02_00685 [Rikenellaceae bacterium]